MKSLSILGHTTIRGVYKSLSKQIENTISKYLDSLIKDNCKLNNIYLITALFSNTL